MCGQTCTGRLVLQRASCKYRFLNCCRTSQDERLVPSLPLELSSTTRYLLIPRVIIAACTERKARVGSFAASQVASKTPPKEEVTTVRIILPFRPLGENRCFMFCATPSLQPRAVGLGGSMRTTGHVLHVCATPSLQHAHHWPPSSTD